MLFSNASLYPDARRAGCVHIGSILFGKIDDKHWAFRWYPNVDGIVTALESTDSIPLRTMLQELGQFLRRQLKNAIDETDDKTEDAVALNFMSELPHNLRLTKPKPWPPEKVETLTRITQNSNEPVTV
jgi:hypothetical protein